MVEVFDQYDFKSPKSYAKLCDFKQCFIFASTWTLWILKPCIQKRTRELVAEVKGNKMKFDGNSNSLFYIKAIYIPSNKM